MGRDYTEVHIGEDCTALEGQHDNGLFFECKFDRLRGVTLKECVLSGSEFITKDLRDALGFTVTMNCHSFRDVKLSPELFDLFLLLLVQSAGNDEKREKLKDVIGRDKAERLLELLKRIE